MTEKNDKRVWREVVSPFCGIASDDLTIEVEGCQLTVVDNADSITKAGFETAITDTSPRINGQQVDLQQAVDHIASLLTDSKQTVISGMATDLNGGRAAMALADKTGAIVDHMNSDAIFKNLLVLQDTGWVNTTLSEVKNRVDLLLVVGSDIEAGFPRFYDRMIWNSESMFGQEISSRQVVYLGKAPSGDASTSPQGKKAKVLPCDDSDLPEVVSILRALVNGRQIQAQQVGGIDLKELTELAEQLKQARYSVVTWASSMLDFSHAEVTVQMICEMVKDLNVATRCSGLPLGGKEGDTTVNHVAAWQTGYPMRTSFNRGYPDYDPYLFDSQRLLDDDEADVLIWVSSFTIDKTPPSSNAKTVVLGRSGMTFEQEPDVFIPVGTPGIDHAGHIFRTDSVVSLPLKKLRHSGLPSTFEVLSAIEKAI